MCRDLTELKARKKEIKARKIAVLMIREKMRVWPIPISFYCHLINTCSRRAWSILRNLFESKLLS